MTTTPTILTTPATLAFIGSIGHWEILALSLVGLLIFGSRLPQVGRSIGQSIVEFKKGLSSVEQEIDEAKREMPQLEARPDGTTKAHKQRHRRRKPQDAEAAPEPATDPATDS